MAEQLEEKLSFDGKKIKVVGPAYQEGKPDKAGNWREKIKSRDDMLAYLKVGVR